jgi:hypothetical protein
VLVTDLLVGRMHAMPWQIELLIAVAAALVLVSGIAAIRTTRLYCDDQGIWCFRGILPWKKGVAGLRWENLEKVGYEANFGAWFTQSYTITLYHRYTGASNIRLTQVWKGSAVVAKINQGFQQWQRQQNGAGTLGQHQPAMRFPRSP